MRLFTRWLFFVPMALVGFIARYFDNFIPLIAASALEMLRQTKLHRTITPTILAMFAWSDKVSDKSYCLLFGGKKPFSVIYGSAFK